MFYYWRKEIGSLLAWIRYKCFSNLEKEVHKNNLLMFVFIVSVTAGEINVLVNHAAFSHTNIQFLMGIFITRVCQDFCVNVKTMLHMSGLTWSHWRA